MRHGRCLRLLAVAGAVVLDACTEKSTTRLADDILADGKALHSQRDEELFIRERFRPQLVCIEIAQENRGRPAAAACITILDKCITFEYKRSRER